MCSMMTSIKSEGFMYLKENDDANDINPALPPGTSSKDRNIQI